MNITWYVARSGGLVAWGLLVASMTWGLLLATRALGRRPTPAWLLSMHRFLGALVCVFTVVHVVAILADTYVSFSLADVLVPFASSWRPSAVALGIVAMYVLAAIEITSLLRRHLPHTVWRRIHVLSYALFAFATVHGISAGTDTGALLSTGVAAIFGTAVVFFGGAMCYVRSPRSATARVTPESA